MNNIVRDALETIKNEGDLKMLFLMNDKKTLFRNLAVLLNNGCIHFVFEKPGLVAQKLSAALNTRGQVLSFGEYFLRDIDDLRALFERSMFFNDRPDEMYWQSKLSYFDFMLAARQDFGWFFVLLDTAESLDELAQSVDDVLRNEEARKIDMQIRALQNKRQELGR